MSKTMLHKSNGYLETKSSIKFFYKSYSIPEESYSLGHNIAILDI